MRFDKIQDGQYCPVKAIIYIMIIIIALHVFTCNILKKDNNNINYSSFYIMACYCIIITYLYIIQRVSAHCLGIMGEVLRPTHGTFTTLQVASVRSSSMEVVEATRTGSQQLKNVINSAFFLV